MDPREVPDELQNLTEIKEILITTIFSDNNYPITWPQMNSNPVNEFQTLEYIICAFPSLYPTGNAKWIKDVNHHFEKININPIDIFESPIDDAKSEIIDEEKKNLIIEDNEQKEY
ncbi:hypothetical protein RhiirA5_412586 [Rhizophagus irregularis]|uniref:Uncharacterized protein n=1 Tax=Rhizophagus irregularis TaxID=588596 RepID=A0A2N0PYG3_9GLOM|nr:hypothetical protein RhiirA5_412586 [Rhizophagus irregularis]